MLPRSQTAGNGIIRYIEFEDDTDPCFSASMDVNGIERDLFSPESQMEEIRAPWLDAKWDAVHK